MVPKILLVDDEAAICHLIKLHFQTEGYLVYTASDAEEATQMLSHAPDLILLDINMPEVDGLEFCKKVRNHIDCPIIFLTSRITEQDKIIGLRAGGDDYITKPFSLDELTARVEAHLRRENRTRHGGNTRMFGDLFIDYVGRCVYCNEQVIPFSKKEFDIIEFLSLNAGQVFDRERIYERLWGYDAEGSSDILKEHIRRIRTKLAKATSNNYIETVWGCGYKWVYWVNSCLCFAFRSVNSFSPICSPDFDISNTVNFPTQSSPAQYTKYVSRMSEKQVYQFCLTGEFVFYLASIPKAKK